MKTKEYSIDVGNGTIRALFSDLANQANGSVMVSAGNTSVLATAVMSKNEKEGVDYLPLVVDYEERFYAAGLVLGGRFMRREGRPSEEAILTGRLVDRTIRPLFDQHIRRDIQIVITILSIDEGNDPDTLAVIAASLAIASSDIPWRGPVGAVRVCKDSTGELAINPNREIRENALCNLMICGRDGKINMIEAGALQAPTDDIKSCLKEAMPILEALEKFQQKIVKEIGKKKENLEKKELDQKALKIFKDSIDGKLSEHVFCNTPGNDSIYSLSDEWKKLIDENELDQATGQEHFEARIDETLHSVGLSQNKRPDGRAFDKVRELEARAGGISETLHGVGIFYRGGTHVLSVLTLGSPDDHQLIEGMEERTKKYFMHHYNFPPYSSGETGRVGGANRRAIGHGALAEKALLAVLPDRDSFPYTIRIVSESMASNGSTSMGSVCASTLALMDAGVPIKNPVAGIAIGLLMDKDSRKYKILTDIQGPEDHYGDMDFKIAGTKKGINAIQMDVKVGGIPLPILEEALSAGAEAVSGILAVITKTISAPRPDTKESAPKVVVHKIDPDKIGLLIGPGGKTINEIIKNTGAHISVEQDGSVFITGKKTQVQEAKMQVESLTKKYEVGEKLEGEIVKILDFGAFAKIGPNADGLIHVSEIASFRVNDVNDVLNIGDKVPVTVIGIDPDKDRISLSIAKDNPDFIKEKHKSANRPGVSNNLSYNKTNERYTGQNNRGPYKNPRFKK